MLLEMLFSSPKLAIVWIVAIVVALTVHEFAHALVGVWRGDRTAEHMGRLTLNPIAHIDPFGFLMLLVLGFGWAKPVPFDPRNLEKPLVDGLWIALAGPGANLVLAGVGAVVFRGLSSVGMLDFGTLLGVFLVLLVLVNLLLLCFNLIPIHPLDGSKLVDLLAPPQVSRWLMINGPRIMLALVLISLLTRFNPFFFVQVPAFLGCDVLLGTSCGGLLGFYFGG